MFRPICFLGVLLLAVALLSSAGQPTQAADTPIRAGDKVKVAGGPAPVKVGKETLATLEEGTELTVKEVEGQWAGVEIENEGKKLEGWISLRHLKHASRPPVVTPPGKGPPPKQADTWKRILAEGKVFARDDLGAMTTAFAGLLSMGAVAGTAATATRLGPSEPPDKEPSRISEPDLVAAYGPPDSREPDPKRESVLIYRYGEVELIVTKGQKRVLSQSLGLPDLLWVSLHKYLHGSYPRSRLGFRVESPDLVLPEPNALGGPKAPEK